MTQTAIKSVSTAASRTNSRYSPARILARFKTVSLLYLIMLPTIISMLVFSYYPKLDVIIKAFYRWEPGAIEEFIGFKNFQDAIADPLFWNSFQLVIILLVANLIKMWPGIITAIALHRLASDRWRYIFQVAFVIPMVIPGLVWLLIWKSFYEPDFGILNRFLNLSGGMDVLVWLDGTKLNPGVMPHIADKLAPIINGPMSTMFASVWGMLIFGAAIMTCASRNVEPAKNIVRGLLTVGLAVCTWQLVTLGTQGYVLAAAIALIAAVVILVSISRVSGPSWLLWALWMLAGQWACRERLYMLPVLVLAAEVINFAIRSMTDMIAAKDYVRWIGLASIIIGCLFIAFGKIWVTSTGQFEFGSPAWLGNKDLVLPAIIFWGFPWVGTVGVLIYLSGLQQISTDVYEAAELDGVGPIRRVFSIELPLIMTQVRINLIFMTIGTLTAYEFFLILLGPAGGPGNKGMVPGLYMYQQAFMSGRFGYACALGMVLFMLVLLLTVIYQRYVKVEK
jgi:ABC-type sugar transport system permease subunit